MDSFVELVAISEKARFAADVEAEAVDTQAETDIGAGEKYIELAADLRIPSVELEVEAFDFVAEQKCADF